MEVVAALPSPNAYDDFIAAENQLQGGLPDLSSQSAEELSRIVAEHDASLKRAREGLTRDCRVPIDYSPAGITNIMDHLGLAKTLGLLLREQGHLAEMNSDYAKAARCYFETIQFASKRFHGGLVIHQLVSIALARTAEVRLEQIIPKLKVEDCQNGIATLLEIEQIEEPIAEILHRDAQWGRRVTGTGNLQLMVMKLFPQFRKPQVAASAKLQEGTRSRRKLLLRLAARAFEIDTGKAPSNVSDLIPKYLPNVPKDPDSGTALTLQKF
jgi:hypothetical protein